MSQIVARVRCLFCYYLYAISRSCVAVISRNDNRAVLCLSKRKALQEEYRFGPVAKRGGTLCVAEGTMTAAF